MMSIDPRSLLSPDAYAAVRATLQPRMIAHRRARSLSLGPSMRLCFEDETTVRHQILEVIRAERLRSAEEHAEQVVLYQRWLPGPGEWKATLMIELPEQRLSPPSLQALSRAVHCVYVACGRAERCFAQANLDLPDRHLARPGGVHFLVFSLPPALRRCVVEQADITLGCDDDHYAYRRLLPAPLCDALGADLLASAPDTPRTPRQRASVVART